MFWLALLMSVSLYAQAEPPGWARSSVVRFADLNMNTAAGVERLYARIKGAAEYACHDLDDRQLVNRQQYQTCKTDAIAGAVVQVDIPQLTSVYSSHNHGTLPQQVTLSNAQASIAVTTMK